MVVDSVSVISEIDFSVVQLENSLNELVTAEGTDAADEDVSLYEKSVFDVSIAVEDATVGVVEVENSAPDLTPDDEDTWTSSLIVVSVAD